MNTTEPFVNAVNFDPVELVRKHFLAGLCDENLLFIEFRRRMRKDSAARNAGHE